MGRLDGKTALITGAASGLGAAAARRFAAEGARVAGLDLARPDWWSEVEAVAPGASFAVVDYGRAGIRVNCVCPGFIEGTAMFSQVIDGPGFVDFKDQYRETHKLGRFGRPEEIAAAILFLASDDASFVAGHGRVVDGGFTAGMRTGLSGLFGIG